MVHSKLTESIHCTCRERERERENVFTQKCTSTSTYLCIYRQKGSGEAEIREPTRGGSGRDQPHNQTNPAEQHPPRPPKKRGGSKKNAGRHKTCRVKGGIPKTTPTLYPQTAKPWRQSQPRRRPTGVGGFWNLGFVPLCYLCFPLPFDSRLQPTQVHALIYNSIFTT